ncbi:DUF5672 family protein [Confluentibacter sediminis]|uniref:DUF5672 family protein n=1 Tax=Confluentibacter sediminis TaxID=2219045 RepID=UPI000DAD243B|nr:DUF5672 family protein [Confluentibacter sediminis]
MQENLVTIVIPICKVSLSETEQMSLNQCVKLLGDFDIVFAQPEKLDSSSIAFGGKIRTELFPDSYFENVYAYNSLMLSDAFYERFLDFKYMLVYQLDAFVFRNELEYWCNKGYDYIGAPWIASPNTVLKKILTLFYSQRKKERQKIFFKVGNGGFSLRNIYKSYKIAQDMKSDIEANLKRDKNDFYIMEDVFWSIIVPKHYPDFGIPEYKEALGFAMDRKPNLAFKLNKNRLPFGCHGFDKPKVKSFWKDILISNYLG